MSTVSTQKSKQDGISPRIARLKQKLMDSAYEVDIERARYYTQDWKESEHEPPAMRAALGLKKTLQNMSIRIGDDELLVGSKTFKPVASVYGVERGTTVLNAALRKAILAREGKLSPQISMLLSGVGGHSEQFDSEVINMPDEVFRELTEEILPYWEGEISVV